MSAQGVMKLKSHMAAPFYRPIIAWLAPLGKGYLGLDVLVDACGSRPVGRLFVCLLASVLSVRLMRAS